MPFNMYYNACQIKCTHKSNNCWVFFTVNLGKLIFFFILLNVICLVTLIILFYVFTVTKLCVFFKIYKHDQHHNTITFVIFGVFFWQKCVILDQL